MIYTVGIHRVAYTERGAIIHHLEHSGQYGRHIIASNLAVQPQRKRQSESPNPLVLTSTLSIELAMIEVPQKER